MASIRLTDSIRRTIKSRVIEHGFKERETKLTEAEHALAVRVYERLYSEQDRAILETAPEDFFDTTTAVTLYIDGLHYSLNLPARRRVAANRERFSLTSKDKMASAIVDYRQQARALAEKRRDAETQAWAVLSSAGTLAKLIQVWPEVESFTADFGAAKPCVALAVPIAKLNASLGLPPDERKAA